MALKLYLIRHAEPVVTGVFLGCRNDVPLKNPPLKLDLPVEAVYVSPLMRARQTAEGIAAPKIIVHDLREIDFGEWGGLSWTEIEKHSPNLASRVQRNWFGTTPPGGECWTDFTMRVRAALIEIMKDTRDKAIVAHGAVNSIIAGELGYDPIHFKQGYGQVTEFDV